MSMHSPVVFGETSDLRVGIESMLSSDGSAVTERLAHMDSMTRQLGLTTTFGAEIEFALPEDPLASDGEESEDLDALYVEVAMEVGKLCGVTEWNASPCDKGDVVTPASHSVPVMLNFTYDERIVANDDEQDGVLELRTAPADPVEAVERYWRSVQAIGMVAARHGRMGMILSTHMNVAVDKSEGEFVGFDSEEGALLVAAVQHSLNAMNPLQVEAGIEEGINVLEAFPDFKDASTTIHDQRLELRHPDVGVVDPRVDLLSVLGGVYRVAKGAVPASALSKLHSCANVWADTTQWQNLGEVLRLSAMWDITAQRMVTPAFFSRPAWGEWVERYFDTFVSSISHGRITNALADNGTIMRHFIGDLRLSGRELTLRPGSPFYDEFNSRITGAKAGFYDTKYRVVPHVVYDTPETHLFRRRNIAQSSVVRSALGTALSSLTPAAASVDIRNDLVKNHMVVARDE